MANKSNKKQRWLSTTVLYSALAISVAATSVFAAESEQFSLSTNSSVLFDGGSGQLTGVVNGIPYEIIHGYAIAQGDMVVGRLSGNGRLEVPVQARGLGQAGALERWPDGIVPYQFSPGVTQIQRDRAQEAISHWNARTSIRLVARNTENQDEYNDFINFEPSNGCASWVGRTGGKQEVWLADNCTVGSIIHEIGHAIGLFHEHTRPDRDDFVTVNWDNVSSGKELNFEKIDVGAANYGDYDYGSIMHYGEFFFTSNGNASISVPDGVEVGQREALSTTDANSVDDMYATDLKLGVSTSPDEEFLRVDITVSNIGSLGANTLKLTANMADDTDWLSVSANSGWDCQRFGAELRCTRTTLIEQDDSSFTVIVDPKSADVSDLRVRVESRTKDVELANNVFNDVIPDKVEIIDANTSSQDPTQTLVETDGPDATENPNPGFTTTSNTDNTTDNGDNNTGTPIATNNTDVPEKGEASSPTESSSGGGGGAIGFFLLFSFLGFGIARRVKFKSSLLAIG